MGIKAIITKIQDNRIYAKSVNPLGEKPKEEICIQTGMACGFPCYHECPHYFNKQWQQAESERVELELHSSNKAYSESGEVWIVSESNAPALIKIGDSIEVTREGNFFKII